MPTSTMWQAARPRVASAPDVRFLPGCWAGWSRCMAARKPRSNWLRAMTFRSNTLSRCWPSLWNWMTGVRPRSMKTPDANKSSGNEHFSAEECEALYRVINARRDMRHFLPNTTVDEAVLQRLLQAAHSAPSVGLMQPWRFIRVRNADLRTSIATLVNEERQLTAQALAEREQEFMRLKVEGL